MEALTEGRRPRNLAPCLSGPTSESEFQGYSLTSECAPNRAVAAGSHAAHAPGVIARRIRSVTLLSTLSLHRAVAAADAGWQVRRQA